MTSFLPDKLRAFFAISLSEDMKKALESVMDLLKQRYPGSSLHWIAPSQWHVTLQFMAALKITDVVSLANRVQQAFTDFSAFSLTFQAVELFPSAEHPHIISLNVSSESEKVLANLAQRIGTEMELLGYSVEKRPFRAHLTLARVKDFHRHYQWQALDLPSLPSLSVEQIDLYYSEQQPRGSIYHVLASLPLKRMEA